MALTEESRYHLHQRLSAVLGNDEATTLMEHLPPVGWADVATKHDLDHLERSVRQELAIVRSGLLVEIHAATNRLLIQLLGAMLAFVTVVLVVARIG